MDVYSIFVMMLSVCTAIKEEHYFSMPPVITSKEDEYVCSSKELDFEDHFVENIQINADKSKAHHVTTGFCEEPLSVDKTWSCGRVQGRVCNGKSVNFGTFDDFTKDDAPMTFPKNVSIRIGKKTDLKYLIIQIHFRSICKDSKQSAANVTLRTTDEISPMYFQSYSLINTGYIPSKQTKGFFSEVACPWKLPPVYAFRYFTHTHHHGYFVEGFRVRNGTWTLIGSQLVKLKKTDYMTIPGGPLLIQKGDALVSRCFYINPQDKDIQIGLKFDDEMCNFDIDFGYHPKFKESFGVATACETETPAFSLCDHKEVNGLCS